MGWPYKLQQVWNMPQTSWSKLQWWVVQSIILEAEGCRWVRECAGDDVQLYWLNIGHSRFQKQNIQPDVLRDLLIGKVGLTAQGTWKDRC